MSAALALCRFGQDAAALLLWGASAYLRVLVPRALALAVAARLRGTFLAIVAIAAVATFVRLPAEVAAIGEGWGDATDPAMVGSVLRDTGAGHAWQVQAAAALLLVLALLLPIEVGLTMTAGASGLLLIGLCLTGHASMHDGWLGALNRANSIVHVLAAAAWLGALVPVLLVLGPVGQRAPHGQAAVALKRFSEVGHVAVALVLLSGAVSTALVLGRWPTDLQSPYQAMLDAKIGLVALMVGLALINRYVLVDRIARQSAARRALRIATLAEVSLGLATLALVAVFGLLDPGWSG